MSKSLAARTMSRMGAVPALFLSICIVLVSMLLGAGKAYADSYSTSIDTLDDAYVAPAGSNNWTTEHDAVYQTYVGDTVDMRSDMDLDPVLTQMDAFEKQLGMMGNTSGISLADTNGDLTVTIEVPEGCEINVGNVYMEDNDLYQITSRSTTGTVVGPGSFTMNMSLIESFTTYDALKAAIAGLPACDLDSDGFQHEIRVIFPGIKVNEDMLQQSVTTGLGSMTGGFSATASAYGGLIDIPFTIGLTSHQNEAGLDADQPAGSTVTSVTMQVNPLTSATATKVWDDANNKDGIRPSEVTFLLQKTVDGVTSDVLDSAFSLNADNGWTATISDLPSAENGELVTYSFSEPTVPDGYTATVSTDGLTITNSHTPTVVPTVSVKATKVWNDSDDADKIRPASVTFQLQKTVDGVTSDVAGSTVTLCADNSWAATITDLPTLENGKPVTYSFTEPTVPEGYTAVVSTDGLTITNTHTSATAPTTPTTPTTTLPKTGDVTNLLPICILGGLAALSFVAALLIRRRRATR